MQLYVVDMIELYGSNMRYVTARFYLLDCEKTCLSLFNSLRPFLRRVQSRSDKLSKWNLTVSLKSVSKCWHISSSHGDDE